MRDFYLREFKEDFERLKVVESGVVCDSYYKGAFALGSGWGDFPRESEADGIELASIFEHSRERCGHTLGEQLLEDTGTCE
jgi:hypothetical protein